MLGTRVDDPELPGRPRSRGAWLVVGLFALGGVVLWGLYQAPRATSPPAPAGGQWGAPTRPIRVASVNALRLRSGVDRLADAVREIDADFVLIQEIDSRDVVGLARALGMQRFHHPGAFARAANIAGPKATWGNAIFSKHPLYDAGPIPSAGGASVGLWATSVIEGSKFVIANVHLSVGSDADFRPTSTQEGVAAAEWNALATAWGERGRPPMIVGGQFAPHRFHSLQAAVTRQFVDVLASTGQRAATLYEGISNGERDRLFASAEWAAKNGGVISGKASDPWIACADFVGAGPAVTRPSTDPVN